MWLNRIDFDVIVTSFVIATQNDLKASRVIRAIFKSSAIVLALAAVTLRSTQYLLVAMQQIPVRSWLIGNQVPAEKNNSSLSS